MKTIYYQLPSRRIIQENRKHYSWSIHAASILMTIYFSNLLLAIPPGFMEVQYSFPGTLLIYILKDRICVSMSKFHSYFQLYTAMLACFQSQRVCKMSSLSRKKLGYFQMYCPSSAGKGPQTKLLAW